MWPIALCLILLLVNTIDSRAIADDGDDDGSVQAASYYLYTPLNTNLPHQLIINDVKSVQESNFNPKLPTKIIIHGWTMSYQKIPNNELRTAYQSRGDYNIISIDWSAIAALNYIEAKIKAPRVGASCASFVQFMVNEFGLDVSNLVVIGHSMGAHIAGFCGKDLKTISNGQLKLGHIVALDPAFPLYLYDVTDGRLHEDDAKNVICLHTNGLFKGQLAVMGHTDYYANGGRKQPGCGLDLDGGCAHARAVHFFAEAIRQVSSFAPYAECANYSDFLLNNGKCDGLTFGVELDDPLDVINLPGIYTFTTKEASPYGQLL
ncbi:uncharacterized protein Dwil_GK19961 [Drosophila willistoni]|uniref:Lipase domain-containing protein n=1 Tax=Drosophila willistoni TaxID=7260 RepID=B4MSF0_DROWI|nr:phospholipase A1 [Drosophila willistoni]EDW75039.1 uncharacterized protein Dwil_GK19961 [Drosophila willistoni]